MTKEEFIKNYEYQSSLKANTKDVVKISDFENYARGLTENERYWNAIQLVYNFHPAIDEVEGKKQIASIVADYGIGIVMAMVSQAQEAKERDNEMQRLSEQREKLRIRIKELTNEIKSLNDRETELNNINLDIKFDWKL